MKYRILKATDKLNFGEKGDFQIIHTMGDVLECKSAYGVFYISVKRLKNWIKNGVIEEVQNGKL